ncbi:MAG: hypothetical protein ACYTF7_09690 [Planctomycetota bacterium]|jgi:hypothetical protein
MAKKKDKEKKQKAPKEPKQKRAKQVKGMQMPGGAAHSGPQMNVYTGLSFLSVLALGAAIAIVYINSQKLAPSGASTPLDLQQVGDIRLD